MKAPFYHFSVDDVFKSLIDVTDKKIDLFDNPFFFFLKNINRAFNTQVDLYLFYQGIIDGKLRTLKDVPSSLKQTLEDNTWMRFGPHSLDFDTAPYAQDLHEQIKVYDKIYKEVNRFAGKNNLSRWIRLHYFSESYELADYFNKKGIEAIFTTDKERITTRMSSEINQSLKSTGFAEYDGLKLIRSDLRIENLANDNIKDNKLDELILEKIGKQNHLCFFTHEYEIERSDVRMMTKKMIRNFYSKGIFSYGG